MQEIIPTPMFEEVKLRKKTLPPNIKYQDIIHEIVKSAKKIYGDTQLVCEIEKAFLNGCLPAKLYGLPKVHKDGTPMRPILSTIGSANYIVAKILNKIEGKHRQRP